MLNELQPDVRKLLDLARKMENPSHMNIASPKSFFDALGLVSLLDTR